LLEGRADPRTGEVARDLAETGRWREREEVGEVKVFENRRALPRAWLASEVLCLTAEEVRNAIREARLPDGRPFDPRATALVEHPVPFEAAGRSGRQVVEVAAVADGRVEVVAETDVPAFL